MQQYTGSFCTGLYGTDMKSNYNQTSTEITGDIRTEDRESI